MINYDATRDVSPAFVDRVTEWIVARGEVLIVLRYLRAAGAKDFALCRTQQALTIVIENAPRGTDIEVFREPQLPLRGLVTEQFIESALNKIRDGEEYLVVSTEPTLNSCISRFSDMGDSHDDLRETLLGMIGSEVAVGTCPNFCAPDHDGLISASKGGIDGPR
jgi:hypothetical protein